MSGDDWNTVLNVHLRGAFLMSRSVQKHMVDQRYGRIVNLSSSSALGNRGKANYSAAKAGMQGLTKTLAIELGQFGITANAVAPFHRHGYDGGDRRPARHDVRGLPGGRGIPGASSPEIGQVDDVAHTIIFPGQRGCRIRFRPGDLCGGRPTVLNAAAPMLLSGSPRHP